ncbi:MAG TPA: DUF3570 domain-containing protein [Candidatus Limnocylindria bacterium]|nr:DUF3570 domain-containing protein [Candidatus Limnocylindria bacterium]
MAIGVGLCAASTPASAAGLALDEQTPGAMLRHFTDSDKVSVRSWMGDYALALQSGVGLDVHWNNERVTIPAIDAAAGTQEAIDAITTASRPISGNAFQDYVKVRNEFQGAVSRGGAAVDYYHSSESDYLAQQLTGRYARDFMNQQLNFSLGTSYGWDAIEPLDDDDTSTGADRKTTMHVNAVATRVVTSTTLVRFGVEYNVVDGLQHNPYRNVYAGGTNVPERHPDHRERRDAFVKLSQYLQNRSSVKLTYRYYTDDWGIGSHEVGSRLNQYITRGVLAGYQYRWYSQNHADFYRDEYTTSGGIDGYRSGDYRMADLSSHLFGFTLNVDLDALAVQQPLLGHMGVWLNYERYFNSNNYSANILETGLEFRF